MTVGAKNSLDRSTAFAPPEDWAARFAVPECDDTLYVPNFVDDAQALSAALDRELAWDRESIVLFGRSVEVPRLSVCYGDEGVEYRYSNVTHAALRWPMRLRALRDRLQSATGMRFNFVLANLYRDGNDSMGWHADGERELGARPVVASISLGATRPFKLRARDGSRRRAALNLESGSLLLMWGRSQRIWQHAVPKLRTHVGRRINLTFRDVHAWV
jgi:alkylated DNA repair dioxygenase AlkB